MKKYKVEVQRIAYFDETIEIEMPDDATEEEIIEKADQVAREETVFDDETGADYEVGSYEEIE